MIPRIIHQIWLQGSEVIPEHYKEYQRSIIYKHPEWEYYLWSESSINQILTSDQLEVYNSMIYLHQKVDYARYIILYLYGGVYIDMDVKAHQPLDTLLERFGNHNLIISKTNSNYIENMIGCGGNKHCLNNGIIFSCKGNDNLGELIAHINNNYDCPEWLPRELCIQHTTGPIKFTDLLNNKPDVLILDPEFLEPCLLGKCDITDNTYLEHSHGLSWVNPHFSKFLTFYVYYKWNVIMACILLYILYNAIKT